MKKITLDKYHPQPFSSCRKEVEKLWKVVLYSLWPDGGTLQMHLASVAGRGAGSLIMRLCIWKNESADSSASIICEVDSSTLDNLEFGYPWALREQAPSLVSQSWILPLVWYILASDLQLATLVSWTENNYSLPISVLQTNKMMCMGALLKKIKTLKKEIVNIIHIKPVTMNTVIT